MKDNYSLLKRCRLGCGRPVTDNHDLCRIHARRERARREKLASVADGELYCSGCGNWKPDEDFGVWKQAYEERRGRANQCKSCVAAAWRDRRDRKRGSGSDDAEAGGA